MEEVQDYKTRRFIIVEAIPGPDDLIVVSMDLPRRRLVALDLENAQRLAETILWEVERSR